MERRPGPTAGALYGFMRTVNKIMKQFNCAFLCLLFEISIAWALQRAKWHFEIAPFDLYYVCDTQSNIEQSMELCMAVCQAGAKIKIS